jgi:hypothetical protein
MPKHYKEMMDEIINKMVEDAPANAVAHGGVDMNPTGKKTILTKKKEPMKRIGDSIKENSDNNSTTLRGILNTLDKLEKKIDEVSGVVQEEIKITQPEEKKRFVDKFRVK